VFVAFLLAAGGLEVTPLPSGESGLETSMAGYRRLLQRVDAMGLSRGATNIKARFGRISPPVAPVDRRNTLSTRKSRRQSIAGQFRF
jgi:hypothetical protein